jgi:hypothetical protein
MDNDFISQNLSDEQLELIVGGSQSVSSVHVSEQSTVVKHVSVNHQKVRGTSFDWSRHHGTGITYHSIHHPEFGL